MQQEDDASKGELLALLDRMTEPDSDSGERGGGGSGVGGVAVSVLTLICSDNNPQQLLDLYVMLKNTERSVQYKRKFLPCFYRVIVRCCTCAGLNPKHRQVFLGALLSHCNLQWALEQLYLQRGSTQEQGAGGDPRRACREEKGAMKSSH